MLILQLTTIAAFVLILISIVIDAVRNGITPTPSSKQAVHTIVHYLQKQPTENKKIYDLGSGFGTLIFPIARYVPHQSVHGIENALFPYITCKLRNSFTRNKVELSYNNMYKQPLHDADYIICYIHRKGMLELKKQFEEQLKPGCTIISHFFTIPGWTPVKTLQLNDWQHSKVYIYQLGKSEG